MKNPRRYGSSPYRILLIHGGAGAPGEMEPVARFLSSSFGVLEPLQTASSVDGQVEELHHCIKTNATLPVVLIGYSWGAWLAYLLTAKYPQLVRKLILVSSGPFEEQYASNIDEVRLSRLSKEKRKRMEMILESFKKKDYNQSILQEFGGLMEKVDLYDPIENQELPQMKFQPELFDKVWNEASALRKSGELLKLAKKITCPVVAIHGDFDPHPSEGVKIPLSKVLKDFHFIELSHCGHTPWKEKEAADLFYKVLVKEISA